MKKRNGVILVVLSIGLIIVIFVALQVKPSKSSEIKDLSNITLPLYSLPNKSLTKADIVENALKMSEIGLKHGQVPENPQCVLITYGEYVKLFSPDFVSAEIPNDKLFYLVTVDVDRTAPEEVVRWHHGAKSVTFHQDYYLISPGNGNVITHGYERIKWILPKQK